MSQAGLGAAESAKPFRSSFMAPLEGGPFGGACFGSSFRDHVEAGRADSRAQEDTVTMSAVASRTMICPTGRGDHSLV